MVHRIFSEPGYEDAKQILRSLNVVATEPIKIQYEQVYHEEVALSPSTKARHRAIFDEIGRLTSSSKVTSRT